MRTITIIALSILTLFLIAGCVEKPIGGERDEHGCLPTAGYTWCEAKQKCLRTWEEPCENEIETRAKEFCDDENIGAVYVCDDYIQVVSMVPGAGSTFYKSDGTTIQCPLVAPSSMSEECRQLFFETECEEVCTPEIPAICEDKCGDGICQVIVCLGTGCPCAETPETCPEDCG